MQNESSAKHISFGLDWLRVTAGDTCNAVYEYVLTVVTLMKGQGNIFRAARIPYNLLAMLLEKVDESE